MRLIFVFVFFSSSYSLANPLRFITDYFHGFNVATFELSRMVIDAEILRSSCSEDMNQQAPYIYSRTKYKLIELSKNPKFGLTVENLAVIPNCTSWSRNFSKTHFLNHKSDKEVYKLCINLQEAQKCIRKFQATVPPAGRKYIKPFKDTETSGTTSSQ